MRKFTVKTLTNFNLLLLTPLFLAVQAQAAEPPRWYGSLDVALASDEIDGFKVRGIGTGEAIGAKLMAIFAMIKSTITPQPSASQWGVEWITGRLI